MKKRLIIFAGCLVLIGVVLGGWAYYSLSHFSARITPTQMEEAQIAFKGTLGELMFEDVRAQENPTGQNVTLGPPSEGLIAAYQKDPAKFKRYALLFDTVINAKQVGNVIRTNRSNFNLPLSSATLKLGNERFDAWGHPYCVAAIKSGLAVVSAGPQSVNFECNKRQIPMQEIAAATRTQFQTAGGQVVVLLADKDAQAEHR